MWRGDGQSELSSLLKWMSYLDNSCPYALLGQGVPRSIDSARPGIMWMDIHLDGGHVMLHFPCSGGNVWLAMVYPTAKSGLRRQLIFEKGLFSLDVPIKAPYSTIGACNLWLLSCYITTTPSRS